MMKFKSLFRRGPSQGKQESTLKGAPSVSSLDSKHHKVAPARDKTLKIFGSKEKLHKAHKKKDIGNNNAVLEDPELAEGLGEYDDGPVRVQDYGSAEELGGSAVEGRGSQECISLPVTLNADHMPGFQEVELRPRVPSEASLASGVRELETLKRELEVSTMERIQLQARVDELLEKSAEAEQLRTELERLKSQQSEREAALERLADENGALRARLRGVAHSPLSDSEKRQLLLAPAPRRMHSSAPASIALAHNGEGETGEASTPEWDKHSSSSLSEVSVACLQDRILQMEEHHYSTSEELQATLAELADLQTQLADAHADNERLADEKQVLLESLCRQTEKLEDSRTKVDTLQELLLREGVEPETLGSGDTDQQLFAVLKMSQEERRHLLSKQEQLDADLTASKTALEEKTKENETLTEKVRALEGTLERAEAERLQWEGEAGAAREMAAAKQHQITTLTDLLDAAKAKLAEGAGAAAGAAEAEAAAAAARREAEAAAARAHALSERLARAQRQLDRAHSDARKMHDDALVSRNNAKSTISELEFQIEQLRQEKTALQGEVKTLQDNVAELQIQVQVAADEKLALMSRAGEALARAADAERQLQEARARITQVTRDRERDEAEWQQFQNDLLMTVRVANDFKTEAQKELERLVSENKIARDRIRMLEDQIHSLKGINRSESVDSIHNYSDDEKCLAKDNDFMDNQSDSSSKDIFKNIRTRYLSRVHSVSDPSLKDTNIVDQAFYRLNSVPEPKNDLKELLPEGYFEVENVTVDETNDDESLRDTSSDTVEDFQTRILAEAILPPLETKELKRQNAIELKEKINRQNAIEELHIHPDLSEENDLIDLHTDRVKPVSKSESSNKPIPRERTIFSRNLSGVYNGKPKSYSMDNLLTNREFKETLHEATSIEFLGEYTNYSNSSLFTEGSDSVFSFPIETNNNKYIKPDRNDLRVPTTFKKCDIIKSIPDETLIEESDKTETVSKVPVVKAESILPYPYPNDIISIPKFDPIIPPVATEMPKDVHKKLEKEFIKVNEELKHTFKAAIERMTGSNKGKSSPSPSEQLPRENDCNNSNVENLTITLVKKQPVETPMLSIISEVDSENFQIPIESEEIIKSESNNNQKCVSFQQNSTKNDCTVTDSISFIDRDGSKNPFVETLTENPVSSVQTTPRTPIDENVSYHLKINTVNDPSCQDVAKLEVRHENVPAFHRVSKFNAFLTPIKIIDGKMTTDRTPSPVILSPVLIQPIFFQPNIEHIEQKKENKKSTVYYNDIDEVIASDNKTINNNNNEAQKSDEAQKKKGLYQKNTKSKQLPFLSWKNLGSNENIPESKTPSPIKTVPPKPLNASKPIVGRLSKSPEWLIENQYYQPIQNVPFIINTAETITKPNMPTNKTNEFQSNTNPFLPLNDTRRDSEQENYYEEIGQPMINIATEKNVADDDKIFNKKPIQNEKIDEFALITREEILQVPRRPKKPKKEDIYKWKTVYDQPDNTVDIVRKMASITKAVISLSRSPSANEEVKKPTRPVGEIVQSLERKPPHAPIDQSRKLSLQNAKSPNMDSNTGSLPRQSKQYHWKTLEHKRLSHPLRSLNDPSPARLLPVPPRSEETPTPPPLLTSASLQDIMATAASHRRTKGVSRQDSRLSVKSLIESIENAAKAAKQSPATTPVGDWPQGVQTAVTTTGNPIKNGLSEPTAPPSNGLATSNFASKPPASRSARPTPTTAAWRHEKDT